MLFCLKLPGKNIQNSKLSMSVGSNDYNPESLSLEMKMQLRKTRMKLLSMEYEVKRFGCNKHEQNSSFQNFR